MELQCILLFLVFETTKPHTRKFVLHVRPIYLGASGQAMVAPNSALLVRGGRWSSEPTQTQTSSVGRRDTGRGQRALRGTLAVLGTGPRGVAPPRTRVHREGDPDGALASGPSATRTPDAPGYFGAAMSQACPLVPQNYFLSLLNWLHRRIPQAVPDRHPWAISDFDTENRHARGKNKIRGCCGGENMMARTLAQRHFLRRYSCCSRSLSPPWCCRRCSKAPPHVAVVWCRFGGPSRADGAMGMSVGDASAPGRRAQLS